VKRNPIPGTNDPLSATRVRNTVMEIIRKHHAKDDQLAPETISDIESSLSKMLDKASLAMLKNLGFYQTMHFLAYAKE